MSQPELSVVLVTKFGFDRLHRVLATIAAQSIANQLEIVIVSPFDAPAANALPFPHVQYVKCSQFDSLGPPRAAGVHACSAPFLVFGEDHCFPRPGWAAALLSRLREGWAGVGPVVLNHNPCTWTSSADWLLNYGSYSRLNRIGAASDIPPHNSAYPTAALQALAGDLPGLLLMDHHLHARLLSAGGQLCLDPSARVAHTNLSLPRAHWLSQFHGAKVYGATRANVHQWPAHRRAIYAAAFPMIAALRLLRACAILDDLRSLPVLPLLAIASIVAAVGEACGYLTGAGFSTAYRVDEELDRPSGVTAADRRLLLP